jgi:hypothetical protein
LRAGISCSPCFKKECLTTDFEERACMTRLSVDDVVRTVLEKVAAAPIPASSK